MDTPLPYLESQAAKESIEQDPYWPKWNSPWWHLSLMHELGRDEKTPKVAARKLLDVMKERYLPVFFPEEFPPGKNAANHVACFCGYGTIFPALEKLGLDPESELPWVRPLLMKHVLPDGGLNCDDTAYRREKPASSIVATVAALELFVESRTGPVGEEETAFVHGLARDMLTRKLLHAYPGTANDEEREDEEDWKKLCFPRFYFYDALRGLTAITRYAERMKTSIPESSFSEAVKLLETKSKRGPLKIERIAIFPNRSLVYENGEWIRRPASTFPLLEETSKVGEVSESLQREWNETRARIERLIAFGWIT